MSRLLLALFTVAAVANGQSSAKPSDAPSEVPSDVPSDVPTRASFQPSQVPSLVPLSKSPNLMAPFPVTTSCGVGTCVAFESIHEMSAYIARISGQGHVCMCPGTFAPANDNCPSVSDQPALTLTEQQQVTLECDSQTGSKCIYACPQVMVSVPSAGSLLTLNGNGNMQVTGGTMLARIVVEGGTANIYGVKFEETGSDGGGSGGFGGAIHNNQGTLRVVNSTFEACNATALGGAIFSSGNADVRRSIFTLNSAPTGGAIYAEGVLNVSDSVFSSNTANSGPSIGGNAQLAECGNIGILNSPACGGSNRTSSGRMSSSSLVITLLALLPWMML